MLIQHISCIGSHFQPTRCIIGSYTNFGVYFCRCATVQIKGFRSNSAPVLSSLLCSVLLCSLSTFSMSQFFGRLQVIFPKSSLKGCSFYSLLRTDHVELKDDNTLPNQNPYPLISFTNI